MAKQSTVRAALNGFLASLAQGVTNWAGSNGGFAAAAGVVLVWSALGPLFHYSDTWQLVINTGTTIVTFIMVFLIQRTQNKDSLAIHMKLNELVAALNGASNFLIDVEALTEEDLRALKLHYRELAKLSRKEKDPKKSHSIEEARNRHETKR